MEIGAGLGFPNKLAAGAISKVFIQVYTKLQIFLLWVFNAQGAPGNSYFIAVSRFPIGNCKIDG